MNEAFMDPQTIQKTLTAPGQATGGDEELYEVINGQRVTLPPMSIFASWIASRLFLFLGPFARAHDLGHVVSEGLFHMPQPIDRDRRPDLAFVSYQRWPKNRPVPRRDNAWDVVPDLAVEVVSPTDVAEDLQEKIDEYFQAGVSVVWVVYPLRSHVHVYQAPTQVRILAVTDELDGGAVLAGFRLSVAELFSESVGNGATA
jgi:Uma2 family endonuclease